MVSAPTEEIPDPEPEPAPPADVGKHDFFVVGIGASAGGLEALESFFERVPPDTGMAFIVIQHLSPDFKSHMDQLLARKTDLRIHRVEDGMTVEPNSVYLIPPKKEMIISDGKLLLTDKDPGRGLSLPIDTFFRSLANDCGRHAIAVVLSGTGTDGSRGIVDVHEAGGLVVSQDEHSAKFDGMPMNAQQTGVVDLVLPPASIPEALRRYAGQHSDPEFLAEEDNLAANDTELRQIFKLLRSEYNLDFSYYKASTVRRRLERRMNLLGIRSLGEYLSQLMDNPTETNSLYKDLLIGVTHFFRDREVFEALRRDVVPSMLNNKNGEKPLRIWVAGCATGEEAYSIAIVLHETLRAHGQRPDFQMFATDVHRGSLHHAGAGVYSEESLADISDERRDRFFRRIPEGWQVTPELRRNIVFAPHNLIQDAPFTRVDLVSCRNMLIYLQPAAQKKVLSLFHFALNTGGVLLLGASESPGDLSDEFEPLDARWKLYRKRRDVRLAMDMRLPLPAGGGSSPQPTRSSEANSHPEHPLLPTYDMLLDLHMPPSLLIEEDGRLLHAFAGAERFLVFPKGRPSSNVCELLPDEVRPAAEAAIAEATRDRTTVRFGNVRYTAPDGDETFNVVAQPLFDARRGTTRTLLKFEPLESTQVDSPPPTNFDQLRQSRHQLDSLREELRYSRENLQATIEEMETSNEELQAANEELVAANEELQSTNEELQSVNEELFTVNAEHQRKIEELTRLSGDMDNLLSSTEIGVIFLDSNLRIRRYTPRIGELFDLLPQDLGRRIDTFSPMLDHTDMLSEVRLVLEKQEGLEREVRDSRGTRYLLRIRPYEARGENPLSGVVLTLIDIERLKQAEDQLRLRTRAIDEAVSGILIVDARAHDHPIIYANAGFRQMTGYEPGEVLGKNCRFLQGADTDRDQVANMREAIHAGRECRSVLLNYRKDGTPFWNDLQITPVRDDSGRVTHFVGIQNDVTEAKEVERALEQARQAAESANESKSRFLANTSHEIRSPMTAILGFADLLARHLTDPDDLECVRTIQRNGLHLLEILNDILDLSKIEAGKLEVEPREFSPVEMVADVRSLMDVRAQEKRLPLRVEFQGLIPATVRTDPTRLRQILINLLGNAIKFTDDGEVCLRVRWETGGQPRLAFEVVDTGVGIPPEQQRKLFQAFSQAEQPDGPRAGGTGLGLAISRRLAAMLGGEITLVSEPGRGSTFTLRIDPGPADEVELIEPPREISVPDGEALSDLPKLSGRILLVDDRPDIRFFAQLYLQEAGATVEVASNGREALDQVASSEAEGRPYDLLILDMQMPVLDGFATTRELRRSGFERPIIALSAGAMSGAREECLRAGCDEFLSKPVAGLTLAQTVDRLLRGSAPQNQERCRQPDALKLLVVDDNVDNAWILTELLRASGYEVRSAADGTSALSTAEEFRPDAVFLDINLPDMSGYDVIEQMKAREWGRDLIYVAVSGYSEPEYVERSLEAGFRAHVVKPIDMARVAEILGDRD